MKIIAIFLLLLSLTACYTHIGQVEHKWGPPAKVERTTDRIIYYYYFYKAGGSAFTYKGWTSAKATGGLIVVEITTDLQGKILSKRKYWKQPELK